MILPPLLLFFLIKQSANFFEIMVNLVFLFTAVTSFDPICYLFISNGQGKAQLHYIMIAFITNNNHF